jgi:hypothetical protein
LGSSLQERPRHAIWLDILLNLSGYAGFVALASRNGGCADGSADHGISGDEC